MKIRKITECTRVPVIYVKHLLQDRKKLKQSSTLLTVLTLLSDNTLERGMHLLKEEELIDLCRHRCCVHAELLAPFPKMKNPMTDKLLLF
jgi:hypothetical protein